MYWKLYNIIVISLWTLNWTILDISIYIFIIIIYILGDVIWLGGLNVVGSLQFCGNALFMSRLHVATLMFIWPGRKKFLPRIKISSCLNFCYRTHIISLNEKIVILQEYTVTHISSIHSNSRVAHHKSQ